MAIVLLIKTAYRCFYQQLNRSSIFLSYKACGSKDFSYNAHPIAMNFFRFLLCCGNSSVGRARPCQGRGREFESRFPLQNISSRVLQLLALNAGIAQLVEHDLAKVGVASSSLVSRSSQHDSDKHHYAGIAQLVEHDLAKVGVASSSLVSRSNLISVFNSISLFFLNASIRSSDV
jgi:hypothetical protein